MPFISAQPIHVTAKLTTNQYSSIPYSYSHREPAMNPLLVPSRTKLDTV